eukprot:1952684-Rhodomonas_salina.4
MHAQWVLTRGSGAEKHVLRGGGVHRGVRDDPREARLDHLGAVQDPELELERDHRQRHAGPQPPPEPGG